LIDWVFVVTQKSPFPEMTSFPVFKRAICIQNVRPPIPDDMLPCLRNLLELCWHKNPATRPSFAEIIRMLDVILIDAAIADEGGRHFWKNNFVGEEKIRWESFVGPFCAAIKTPVPDPDDGHIKGIRELLGMSICVLLSLSLCVYVSCCFVIDFILIFSQEGSRYYNDPPTTQSRYRRLWSLLEFLWPS
jgi:hypothetical protein